MFLSLTLIAERIHLPPDMIMVHDSSRRKYQDIMFYPEFPEQLSQPFSPDILYLSSGFPPSLPAGMQLPDFICIVKPEEFQQAESSVKQLPSSGNQSVNGRYFQQNSFKDSFSAKTD